MKLAARSISRIVAGVALAAAASACPIPERRPYPNPPEAPPPPLPTYADGAHAADARAPDAVSSSASR